MPGVLTSGHENIFLKLVRIINFPLHICLVLLLNLSYFQRKNKLLDRVTCSILITTVPQNLDIHYFSLYNFNFGWILMWIVTIVWTLHFKLEKRRFLWHNRSDEAFQTGITLFKWKTTINHNVSPFKLNCNYKSALTRFIYVTGNLRLVGFPWYLR